jgi:opacity protein-like surface antigen
MNEEINKANPQPVAETPCGCPVCHCEPCACEASRCSPPKRRPFGRKQPATAIALALVGIHLQPVAAQTSLAEAVGSSVTISLTQTRPMGALGANIDAGYGAFGAFLLPIDSRGLVSLRADLGIAEYGHDTKRTPFSQTVGGRVEVDVRTTHAVVPASVGIQLTPSLGVVEPYINAGVGAQAFFTESGVEPLGGEPTLASTTNHSDIAFAWTLGGGVYVPVTSRLPDVELDIGVQYFQGGQARYLAPGSITDLDDGRIAITPLESATHQLALRVGARIRL